MKDRIRGTKIEVRASWRLMVEARAEEVERVEEDSDKERD